MNEVEEIKTDTYTLQVYVGYEPINPRKSYDFKLDLTDDTQFLGIFFTPETIQAILEKCRISGQFSHGAYYFAQHMVVIPEMTLQAMKNAVEGMIANNDFYDF